MELITRLLLLLSLTYITACTNEETPGSEVTGSCTEIYSQQEIDSSIPFLSENLKQLNISSNDTGYLRGGIVDIKLLSNGVGMAVWSEYDNGYLQIFSSSFAILSDANTTHTRWGTKTRINTTHLSDTTSPAFYMNDCGDAIITWKQNSLS